MLTKKQKKAIYDATPEARLAKSRRRANPEYFAKKIKYLENLIILPEFEGLPKSRPEAKELGAPYYFTGMPCKNGHVEKKNTHSGQCLACKRDQMKKPECRAGHKVAKKKYKDSGKLSAQWRKRYGCDVLFKIAATQRRRLKLALKRGQKSGSAVRDLGCSILELKEYLENHSSWESNFTWGNWGTVWELDHVKALALFDLGNRDQLLQAVHFTNLQPLSVEKHRIKTSVDMDLIRGSKKETPVLGR